VLGLGGCRSVDAEDEKLSISLFVEKSGDGRTYGTGQRISFVLPRGAKTALESAEFRVVDARNSGEVQQRKAPLHTRHPRGG